MKNSILKKEIHKYLEKADERFLRLICSMVQAEKDAKNLILKEDIEMLNRAKQSLKDVENGNTVSMEQFNLDFQKWKKEKQKLIK